MELQLIKRKPLIFRFKNQEFEFVKPYYLMLSNDFKLIKGVVKGSCLCWNVCGCVLTYGKIKSLL
jgi:hypothetical protein